MIEHHPGDDLLLGLASGWLDSGQALVVSVHLEACAQCRGRMGMLRAVGGHILETIEPQPLDADALDRTFARIDSPTAATLPAPPPLRAARPLPSLPPGVAWPRSLAACEVTPWRWMGPGMRWCRVAPAHESKGSVFMLRIAPGWNLAKHTHTDVELTQVLCGSFDDGRALFGPGDFDATDGDVHHQPVVQAGTECVCVAFIGDRLKFNGWLASLVGRAIGM